MRFSKFLPILIYIFTLTSLSSSAQQTDQEKQAVLKTLIESKNFTFTAQTATTSKGRLIRLSSGYEIKMMVDSISADLPFFGLADQSNLNPEEAGVKLNTTQFTYTADSAKKGAWRIDITPKGSKVKRIYMNVMSDGSCNVSVNNVNERPMSYYGLVTNNNSKH